MGRENNSAMEAIFNKLSLIMLNVIKLIFSLYILFHYILCMIMPGNEFNLIGKEQCLKLTLCNSFKRLFSDF